MKNSQLMVNARVYYDAAHMRVNYREAQSPFDHVYISVETLKGGQTRYAPIDEAKILKLIADLADALLRLQKNRAEVARRVARRRAELEGSS